MPDYGDAARVGRRAGNRPLTETSTPSLDDVERWINEAEAELFGVIGAAGGPSSYPVGSRGGIQVRGWVEDYVAGVLRQSHAASGGDGSNDDGQTPIERWEALLNRFRGAGADKALAELDASSANPNAAGGLGSHYHDTDLALTDADVTPLFTIAKGREGGNF